MNAIPIARLLGFEIRIHVSWAIILAVIAVTVAAQVERSAPDVVPPLRWVVGGVVAAGFLVSALLHELGHAVAARRAGLPGGPVVVYFFGGTATPDFEVDRPRAEIVTGLAGPLVSLGLGAVLLGLAVLGQLAGDDLALAVAQIALVVGVLNLVLGGINLLPAFPLDGGRIVRGAAWARTGDPVRATRIAATSGRLVGWTMAAVGILGILVVDAIDGLMLALTGWFLAGAARQVDRRALLDELLVDIRVADVMDREVQSVPPGLTLDTFAGQVLDGSSTPSLPVVRGRELLGIVGAVQLRRVRRDRWPETRAEDAMVAARGLPVVAPETPLRSAFDDLRRSGYDGLPVMEAGELAGMITRRAIVESLRARAQTRGMSLS